MNIAIIGLGYWGKNYLRILSSNDRVKLSAVVEPTQNIKLEEEIKQFFNLEDLLNSEITIDAAVICTPTNTHYEITRKLLNSGIHVLVEKPLATKSAEAKDLLEIAYKNNLTLLVDHTFLYNEAINFAIKQIHDGAVSYTHLRAHETS